MIKIMLLASVALNGILVYICFSSEEVDRTPPWHPFELNSDLTLESIAEEGYRFNSMPCGQVQFTKQLGDTTIQYEVTIDCEDYEADYERNKASDFWPEEYIVHDDYSTWDEAKESTIYYPWDISKIGSCHQDIWARYFSIKMGETIDSLFIREYVRGYGGHIISSFENWDAKNGGSFMVRNELSDLYYHCFITTDFNPDLDSPIWLFKIVSGIPHLNARERKLEEERRIKKDYYYK